MKVVKITGDNTTMKPLNQNSMEELEKAAEEHADNNVFCDGSTDMELYVAKKAFISGAKWMLEKLQDFDTWKEWKDSNI